MTLFATSRSDGRSDRQVVYDLLEPLEPGTTVTYSQLKRELERDCDRFFDQAKMGAAVRLAAQDLLERQCRAVRVLRNVGYRVVSASNHRELALIRKSRGDTQYQRGLDLLNHVRWDELEPNARAAHEGTLLVLSALAGASDQMAARQKQIEESLSTVLDRMGRAGI